MVDKVLGFSLFCTQKWGIGISQNGERLAGEMILNYLWGVYVQANPYGDKF